jgi:hypothetical protein
MLRLARGVMVTGLTDGEDGDEEGIIVDATGGRYFAVNGTALVMIGALTEAGSLGEAADTCRHRLVADAKTLEEDLASLVHELSDLGLLEQNL